MSSTGSVAALVAGAVATVVFAPASASAAELGISGVRFDDPYASPSQSYREVLNASSALSARYYSAIPLEWAEPEQKIDHRQMQLELQSPRSASGFQISVAQRASLAADVGGNLQRYGRGSEVRVALGDPTSTTAKPSPRFYVFAAADNEALTWQPGGLSFLMRERVEIGDHQAGVTYEFGSIQASLALVERKISATVGRHTTSRDESFAGFTLTMRH